MAAVLHSASGGGYDAVPVVAVAVTVTDDDAAGVTMSESSVTVGEAGGEARYTVVLNGPPTGEVTVTVASAPATVATVRPRTLTFTAATWDEPQSVTVRGVDDDVDNPGDARMAMVSHTVSGGGYDAVAAADVRVTVTDDDAVGVTLSPASVTVGEAQGEARYTVRLNTQPTGEVTVTAEERRPVRGDGEPGDADLHGGDLGRAAVGDGKGRGRRGGQCRGRAHGDGLAHRLGRRVRRGGGGGRRGDGDRRRRGRGDVLAGVGDGGRGAGRGALHGPAECPAHGRGDGDAEERRPVPRRR